MNKLFTKRAATVVAATAIGLTGLATANAPAAKAVIQKCWILKRDGQTHKPFDCDVNRRVLADNTIVYDVRHFQGKGAFFTVRLWEDENDREAGADLWINGKRVEVPYYTDKDRDTRLDLGEVEQFVF